jgi:superfamily I DNA/RNA helicase
MVPDNRLDDYQRDVLGKCGDFNKNSEWIQGFAGSGKTILLVHLVKETLLRDAEKSICVLVYTHALKHLIQSGLTSESSVRVITKDQFLKEKGYYDLILIDEVQDIPKSDLASIRARAGKIVIAGDSDQSIYPGNCSTPDEINSALEPRVHKLIILYRLTQRLRNIVKSILPGSSIEAARSDRGQDVQVVLAKADSTQEEIEWLWKKCQEYSDTGDPAVILLPSHKSVQQYIRTIAEIDDFNDIIDFSCERWGKNCYSLANQQLSNAGIPLQYLGNSYGNLEDSDDRSLTYIMTYHSSKGLDFNTVFLPYVNDFVEFWRDDEDTSRRIFFVGATRSRKNLFLSYSSSEPHKYIKEMDQSLLHKINCKDTLDIDDDEEEFIF